jgi:hypothetical protein
MRPTGCQIEMEQKVLIFFKTIITCAATPNLKMSTALPMDGLQSTVGYLTS